MSIKYGREISVKCLSSDTKPTTGIAAGTILKEITKATTPTGVDTAKLFVYSGGWVELNRTGELITEYFADSTNGNNNNGGLARGDAKATIQAAVDLCTGRGRHRVRVAPGGYTESVNLPLNAIASFGELIADTPTRRSGGSVWWASGGASEPCLTVRGRGWRIAGFELDSPTGAAAILLQRNLGGTLRSSWTEIDHNFIGASITGKYGVEFEGADTYIHIHHNDFSLLQAANAAAIFCNTTPVALALLAIIEDNDFRENVNHIKGGASWGFNAAIIRRNSFQGVGDQSPTKIIDLGGGRNNQVYDNDLGISQAQYDAAAGHCVPGTNDQWVNNRVTEGIMDELPGGG